LDYQLGRFQSADPISFSGGDLNLYRYVHNGPSTYTDPLGLLSVTEGAIILSVVTGVTRGALSYHAGDDIPTAVANGVRAGVGKGLQTAILATFLGPSFILDHYLFLFVRGVQSGTLSDLSDRTRVRDRVREYVKRTLHDIGVTVLPERLVNEVIEVVTDIVVTVDFGIVT
jgi:hypothetical protein